MSVIERNNTKEFELIEQTFDHLDDLSVENIDLVLKALEMFVSNGWVGEAAEVSDTLQSNNLINTNPNWRVKVELERMKRHHYFGFTKNAFQASRQVLDFIENNEKELDRQNYLGWKFTAIGQMAWLETGVDELAARVDACRQILMDCEGLDVFNVLHPFFIALKGRLAFKRNNIEEGKFFFAEALSLLPEPKSVRKYAHILLNFAFELRQRGEEESAVKLVSDFLIAKQPLKTHLLIKAYSFLLESGKSGMPEAKQHEYALRMQYLFFAMGLSQAYHIYPVLNKAKKLIPEKQQINFYDVSMRPVLEDKMKRLGVSGRGFERLVAQYYTDMGFTEVELLGDNAVAFDLIATATTQGGSRIIYAVQSKYYAKSVGIGDISDAHRIEEGIAYVKKHYGGKEVAYIDWCAFSGMTKDAADKLKANIEGLRTSTSKLDSIRTKDTICNFYEKNPLLLINLLNREFFE